MGNLESHVGKLRKVDLQGKPLEDWCKEYCNSRGHKKRFYHNSWVEELKDVFPVEYVVFGDNVWEMFEHREVEEVLEFSVNDDGIISFNLQFYNGNLSEILEEGLERIFK